MTTEPVPPEGPWTHIDLTQLAAIKWGDKIINPAEVVFVLTPRPGVDCPQCHTPIGRPHTEYCTLGPDKVWDGVLLEVTNPDAVPRCPVIGRGDARCVRPARHDGRHEWEEQV